ncbi:hypothetical protein AG1IA_10330 [Rhizoctonia solani AG-1 IA]|uniref:Uncharacterized protein n=1 Tax=Thanatephorus cucumeris (strain AG1-IA) TaxID=983506 RepID=L8WCF8_THACA|nr:hypothetical protein AG1IA_10330 [Rhizoctonia solani AG-1 IA]
MTSCSVNVRVWQWIALSASQEEGEKYRLALHHLVSPVFELIKMMIVSSTRPIPTYVDNRNLSIGVSSVMADTYTIVVGRRDRPAVNRCGSAAHFNSDEVSRRLDSPACRSLSPSTTLYHDKFDGSRHPNKCLEFLRPSETP